MPKKKPPDFEQKYRLLLDLMDRIPDVIYFKDTHGRLLMVNQAHARGLGLEPREVIGKTDFDIFPRERAEAMAKDDFYVMKSGKPIIDKIERATRPDGVDNYVTTTKIPRYNKRGEIIGLMGITRDITHRVRLEHLGREKERAEKKLEALKNTNRAKSEFTAVLSHELRTPLAITNESLRQIAQEPPGLIDPRQKKLLSMARNNVERLSRMIDNLMDMSRIERHKLKLHYALVNFNDLVTGTAGFFKKMAREKNITLKYNLPQEQANIFVDGERITQVITNLLNNALKFTEQNGQVIMEIRILESKIRVAVIDTGMGIEKEDLKKLFRRFVQASSFAPSAGKGLGLGLSIAKELVELHGGEIWAESAPGVGSKFYFTLPKAYNISMLDKRSRKKINSLLHHSASISLINISLMHFNKFSQGLNVGEETLFSKLTKIVKEALTESLPETRKKPPLFFQDRYAGLISLALADINETQTNRLCAALKTNIKRHFDKLQKKDVFVNLGIISYPDHKKSSTTAHLLANISLKKICIGSEARHYKRINYKADVEILHAGQKTELSQTVDISGAGLCFLSKIPLETDAEINILLTDRKHGKPLSLRGRVAWRKSLPGTNEKYMCGLDFQSLGAKKKLLREFVKFIS
jgi:PAS domain S-box-containing protein